MNQKNKKIIICAIIALIILGGIVAVNVLGFNKDLAFEQSQRIDIDVGQQIKDESKIKEIANEVLGMHNMVQTVEIYEDMVTIRAKVISEEQKNTIVSKIKEIYEFEQTAEKTDINTVPATRIRDMYKQYILPFAISIALVSIYMVIRYYKKGMWKVLARTIFVPVIAELLLLSWIAIVRIPIGRFTPVLVILMYIASTLYVINKNEK
ncbi:MAG: hypothetical protein IJE68_05710 [Clostridia bacterium]|nr:hypothetical protein [Clostridia bacterium]